MNEPSGYTALDLIGFTDKGNYSSSANYVKNDLVHYNARVWRCLIDDTSNVTPVAGANWEIWIDEAAYLSGLADTTITNPTDGSVLRFDTATSKWINEGVDSTPTQNSNKLVKSGGVYTQLANKANTASLATVATSGAYSDLTGKPSLATVATSGAYSDLTGKPTIPTVNNGTLTIQKNGTTVQTFTANQSSNVNANITVPTKTSDLTNDSNFVSDSSYSHITVDSAMSSSSTNPVQNKVVNTAIQVIKNGLGTAAAKDVPASGNASTTQVVMGNDTRLTDARNAADVPAWAKESSKPTYKGNEIETNVAKTGTAQSSVTSTIGAGTTMDNAVGTLLNNDVTLSSQIQALTNSKADKADEVLFFKDVAVSATTGQILSKSDSKITADHVLVECVFANPSAITTDVTWETTSGNIVFKNATCTSATTVTITLAKKGN